MEVNRFAQICLAELKCEDDPSVLSLFNINDKSNASAIRQISKSQSGCYNKTKHAKFSEKRTFFTL